MLLALLAAAIPAIVHLISRQRARKLPISTLRFLLQTDRKTARKHKLVEGSYFKQKNIIPATPGVA